MPKGLVFLFLLFIYFTRDCFGAINLEYGGLPAEVFQEEPFSIEINLTGASKNAVYYLKACFQKETGTKYFGYTKNNQQEWVKHGEPRDTFYRIETDLEGNWSGNIEAKADTSQGSGFDGEGDYFIKISRSTASSDNWYSNDTKIKILLPLPTATFAPTPTSTKTPTLAPIKEEKIVCKIYEPVDQSEAPVTRAKVYVDGVYVRHFAPQELTFCPSCKCNNEVDCGFGSHSFKLEKSGYENWEESFTVEPGSNCVFYPVMRASVSTNTPVPTSTPISTPTSTLSPTPTLKDERDSENIDLFEDEIKIFGGSQEDSVDMGEVLGEETEKKDYFAQVLILMGIVVASVPLGAKYYKKFTSGKIDHLQDEEI